MEMFQLKLVVMAVMILGIAVVMTMMGCVGIYYTAAANGLASWESLEGVELWRDLYRRTKAPSQSERGPQNSVDVNTICISKGVVLCLG